MVVGQFSTAVDVAVIGAGDAGLAAALEASRRGRSVALVTAGGGLWPGIAADARRAILEARGVTILDGEAAMEGDRQLAVPGHPTVPRLRYRRAVLCPEPGAAEARGSITPGSVDTLAAPPAHAVVRGGAPSEIAAAAHLAAGGSNVRLLVTEAELAMAHGSLVAALLAPRLRAVSIALGGAAAGDDELLVDAAASRDRRSLRLERGGLELDAAGRIAVDDALRTGDPRTTAAGSIAGGPGCGAVAARMGVVAAAGACGAPEPWIEPLDAPIIGFAPDLGGPVAWCGRTGADEDVVVGSAELPHAACHLVVEASSGLLAGAAIAGPGADAAIGELRLAVETAAEPGDLTGLGRLAAAPADAAIGLAAAEALERFAAAAAHTGARP